MVRKHVVVRGEVQGVGFRWHTRAEAERLGVGGWVRNQPDGSVEAEIEGPDEAVQRMLDWLRHGPEWAAVSGLEISELPTNDVATGDRGFRIE